MIQHLHLLLGTRVAKADVALGDHSLDLVDDILGAILGDTDF